MSQRTPFSHDHVVLDACCVINLCATGLTNEILSALPIRCVISSYVKEKEVLRLNGQGQSDGAAIDLDPLMASGLLRLENLDLKELAGTLVGHLTWR